jgi:histidinol phosphatase-like enzyme
VLFSLHTKPLAQCFALTVLFMGAEAAASPKARGLLSELYSSTEQSVPVAFWDADGTILSLLSGGPKALCAADIRIQPGVVPKMREAAEAGALMAIVSNQRAIPSKITVAEAEETMQLTIEALQREGVPIHFYDFTESTAERDVKPPLGMAKRLVTALRTRFGSNVTIDKKRSFMVGDGSWTVGEVRPDGFLGYHHTNADRLFAELLGIPYHDALEYFKWGDRFPIAGSSLLGRRQILELPEINQRDEVKVALLDANSSLRSFDREGTHRRILLLPFVANELRKLVHQGYWPVIVSNSSRVPLMRTFEVADLSLRNLVTLLDRNQVAIGYYDFAGSLNPEDIKPNLGMIHRMEDSLSAAFDRPVKVDRSESVMIGETDGSDAEFARNLGVRFELASRFFGWQKYGVSSNPDDPELAGFWSTNPEREADLKLRACSSILLEDH